MDKNGNPASIVYPGGGVEAVTTNDYADVQRPCGDAARPAGPAADNLGGIPAIRPSEREERGPTNAVPPLTWRRSRLERGRKMPISRLEPE